MSHLSTYVGLADHGELVLAASLRAVADEHREDPEIAQTATVLAALGDDHRERLRPLVDRYGEDTRVEEPDRLRDAAFAGPRQGPLGLLRDLQDLHVLATWVGTTWTVIGQAAQAVRDDELHALAQHCGRGNGRQAQWLLTQLKTNAPQTLLRT